jgi:uncharacterized protein (DUF362 family)
VSDTEQHLETLAALTCPDGGWGYRPSQPAHLEPTCLALLALSAQRERYSKSIDQGLVFVEKCAGADGAYRLQEGRPEAVWPTALVLFVQASLDLPADLVCRTASRLLALRGQTMEMPAEELVASVDIDIKLVGWPWAEGTFSWVEPTAWACLALRRAGYENHDRVMEGQRLLLDRAFDQGGINYGNRKVFGKMTDAVIGPTAVMLLALHGKTDQPRVAAALKYLEQETAEVDDLENLCWAKLALEAHAKPQAALEEKIRRAWQERSGFSWARPSPYREALTALALMTGVANVFRLPAPGGARSQPPIVILPKPRRKPWTERLRAAFQGVVVQAVGGARPVPAETAVHIAPAEDYNADLADVLRRQYEAFRAQVPLAGKRVVLKPNLVEYRPNKVINTHPAVVAAAIELCKREGAAEIIVAEGPGHWRNVEHMVSASGLGDVLKHYGVSFVDLNHDDPVQVVNLGRNTGLQHLYLARTVYSADVLISLAKLKTHHWAGATLSLKNLFGILPGICYGWPKNELHWRGIENSIIDIALTKTPNLGIVDGIIGMEGDGPLNGTPKPLGALVMGVDPVAVDATCCRLMKLDPEKVRYLLLGQLKRLGLLREAQIKQIGERIDALAQPFETLPTFQALYMGRSA